MGLKVRKHEKVDVRLNDDLVDKITIFLKLRKLSMEKILSDAIPLFVLLWEDGQQGRLSADVNLFLYITTKSNLYTTTKSKSTKFKLYFEQDSLVVLKEFAKRHAFDGIESIVNSSFGVFIYLVEKFNIINGTIVVPLQNPEGKLTIELPDYLK